MSERLLDTNVVSFLFKGDSRGLALKERVTDLDPCISFVTLAELYRWPILHKWGQSRTAELEKEISKYRIIESSIAVCRRWAEIASIKGRPMDYHDAWIAATAIIHGILLVTHNRKDFAHIPGLALIA